MSGSNERKPGSNERKPTQSRSIPVVRKVGVNGSPIDLASTPGGSLYATTPGGTRLCYDREFLMKLGESPISKTPPKNLASFPEGILRTNTNKTHAKKIVKKEKDDDQPQDQFHIEL